jgi:hypothetical protein
MIIATTAVCQEYLKTDGTNSMTGSLKINRESYSSIELESNTGAFIDFKHIMTSDYNGRIIWNYQGSNRFDIHGTSNFKNSLLVNGQLKIERDAPIIELFETDNSYSWYFVNDNKHLSIRRGGLSTQALTIDSRGYVGIGITNPTANFIVRDSGNNNLFKHFVVEDQYGNEDLVFDGLGRLKLGYAATFPTDDNFKLSIDGKAIAEEVVVKLSDNWPDYVFAEDYPLMPLSQLENYLKQFKHLPEIPSAAEIEEKGQSLGEMNKLLLKKIEELTLYVIEQQKEIEELKNCNSAIDELAEKIKNLESRE